MRLYLVTATIKRNKTVHHKYIVMAATLDAAIEKIKTEYVGAPFPVTVAGKENFNPDRFLL